MIRQFQPYFKALCWLFPCQWSFLCQGGAQPQKWPVLLLGFSHLEKLYWGGWWLHVVSGSDQYRMPWEECKSNTSIWWRFASTDAICSSEVISACVTGPCFWGDLVGTTDRNSIFTGKEWLRITESAWISGWKDINAGDPDSGFLVLTEGSVSHCWCCCWACQRWASCGFPGPGWKR